MQTKHIKLFRLLGSSSLGVNSPKIALGYSQYLRRKTRGVVTSFATVCNPCFSYGKWNIFKKSGTAFFYTGSRGPFSEIRQEKNPLAPRITLFMNLKEPG